MFLKALSNYGEQDLHPYTTPGVYVRGKRPILGGGEIVHDMLNQWNDEYAAMRVVVVPDGREIVVPKSYLQPL